MDAPIINAQHCEQTKVLARSWAAKHPYYREDDVISEAYVGLVVARDTFEDGHGAKFETWIAFKVSKHLLDWQRREGPGLIHVPRGIVKTHGSSVLPTYEPIETSVEHPGGDYSTYEHEALAAGEWLGEVENRDLVNWVLASLPPSLGEILREKFLHGKSGAAIARERGCSEATVSYCLIDGLASARRLLRLQHLDD